MTDFQVDKLLKPGVSPKIKTDIESAAHRLHIDWYLAGATERWQDLLIEYRALCHYPRPATILADGKEQKAFIDGGGEKEFRYPRLLGALKQLHDALEANEHYDPKENTGEAVKSSVQSGHTGDRDQELAIQLLKERFFSAPYGTKKRVKSDIAGKTGYLDRQLDNFIRDIKDGKK